MIKVLRRIKWDYAIPLIESMGIGTRVIEKARIPKQIRKLLLPGETAEEVSGASGRRGAPRAFEPISAASLASMGFLSDQGMGEKYDLVKAAQLRSLKNQTGRTNLQRTLTVFLERNGPGALGNYVDYLKCSDVELDEHLFSIERNVLWATNRFAVMQSLHSSGSVQLREFARKRFNELRRPSTVRELNEVMTALHSALGEEKLMEFSIYLLEVLELPKAPTLRCLANTLWTQNRLLALSVYEDLLEIESSTVLIRRVSNRYQQVGNMTRSVELLKRLPQKSESEMRRLDFLEARIRLDERGFPLPKSGNAILKNPNTSMYLLHNSLPFASGGYATRTHGIAVSAVRNGWQMNCVTRTGYPVDLDESLDRQMPIEQKIDDVLYHRLIEERNVYRKVNSEKYLQINSDRVTRLAREIRPSVIHGASNHINGIAANYAGRLLDIPSIYEVRGLWELTRMSREPDFENSGMYNQAFKLEIEACQMANHVLTLTKALKDLLIKKGVDGEKITILPNGVDSARFLPRGRDEELLAEMGLAGKVVIGFVGSMPQYEGLDDLLEAMALLKQQGVSDFHLLAVGDGTELESLQRLTKERDLSDCVTFTGRVPHSEVERYYSIIDICPFPRKGQPVCHIVSPLKPFEAMAMGKAVLASNVGALEEFVTHGENGLLHQFDDIGDLAAQLKVLIRDESLRSKLGAQASQWVKDERDWLVLGKQLTEIYSRVTD